MPKFFGVVGFAVTEEVSPAVWVENIVELPYSGDVLRNTRRLRASSDSVNDDIVISNEISILSDPYAGEHFHSIRYVKYGGVKWKVDSVEVQYPRLILTLGGVWNENYS